MPGEPGTLCPGPEAHHLVLAYSKLSQRITWQRLDTSHTLNSIKILLPFAFIEDSVSSDVEIAAIPGMVPH